MKIFYMSNYNIKLLGCHTVTSLSTSKITEQDFFSYIGVTDDVYVHQFENQI